MTFFHSKLLSLTFLGAILVSSYTANDQDAAFNLFGKPLKVELEYSPLSFSSSKPSSNLLSANADPRVTFDASAVQANTFIDGNGVLFFTKALFPT